MANGVKRWGWLFACGLLLGESVRAQTAEVFQALWRDVWQSYSNHYSYFEHKGVDWDQVWQDASPVFNNIADGETFAQRLHETLLVLRDRHVFVRFPSGEIRGYQPEVAFNFHPSRFFYPEYASPGAYTNVNDAGAIVHSWVGDQIAHIAVLNIGSRFTENISDGMLGNLFVRYESAKAMIVDLRANSGGNELNGRRLADRWVDEPRVYAYSRTRVPGADRNAFTEFSPRTLQPSPRKHFRGPVIGLVGEATMSSAESFALMIRALPQGVLIGDSTRGASANPILKELPEIGGAYSISTWIAYDADFAVIEDRGVIPDVMISPDASYDEDRDYVLERAIDWVVRFPTDRQAVPLGWIVRHDLDFKPDSDHDGDGMTDREEYLAGTNPRDAGSSLSIESFAVRFDAIEICWEGIAGKKYQIEWSSVPKFTAPAGRLDIESELSDGTRCARVPYDRVSEPRFFRLRIIPN